MSASTAGPVAAQTLLPLDYNNDVEAAFNDDRLFIVQDDERGLQWHLSFVGKPDKWDCRGSIVHVVSRPAGGEIRGYVRIGNALHLRLPNYAGDWPELDAAVERRLGAKAVR